jgi:hypothetical protein
LACPDIEEAHGAMMRIVQNATKFQVIMKQNFIALIHGNSLFS